MPDVPKVKRFQKQNNNKNKVLQREESPVVVVDVDVGRGVDEEHDPGLQPSVEVSKSGNWLVGKKHLKLMSRSFLKKLHKTIKKIENIQESHG